eukprot:symbB.v1.2.006443.t1/scaffold384.1/size215671/16
MWGPKSQHVTAVPQVLGASQGIVFRFCVTPRRRDGIGDEMSRKPIEHSQLSQESESAPLKTTTPRGHSPVTDGKRGARLGGRKIPVR